MKIHILIYSIYKLKIFINSFYFNNKVFLIIKKNKVLNYFKQKKNIFLKKKYKKTNVNFIIVFHFCKLNFLIHSLKHFFEKNHNSIFENKINDLF